MSLKSKLQTHPFEQENDNIQLNNHNIINSKPFTNSNYANYDNDTKSTSSHTTISKNKKTY